MLDSALIAAIIAFFKALFGRKPDDPIIEEARQNEVQARKSEAVFAAPDRDRAAVDDVLRRHADR